MYYTLEWGRGKGEREATGIYTFIDPTNQTQRDHNTQALGVLEKKRAQMTLDESCLNSGVIAPRKFKMNFLDYYAAFVTNNRQFNNRHLEGSFIHFKAFLKKDFLPAQEITENFCERYRKYLLDHFNGDTPANYFSRFKKVLRAATKEGYFRLNPAEDVTAKSNKNHKRK